VVTFAAWLRFDVEEPLVVPDVEVGLGSVVGHEDLAVLERVHRARIHVEIGIELLHHDPETRAVRRLPRLAAVSPLPNEETTPPVTKMCWCVSFEMSVLERALPRSSTTGL
jgi:hypothetical protein